MSTAVRSFAEQRGRPERHLPPPARHRARGHHPAGGAAGANRAPDGGVRAARRAAAASWPAFEARLTPLYGPPGTGKTLTAMHLLLMPERTVLLLTGGGLGLIEESCTLARLLQPATVILEDIDLIAQERDRAEHRLQRRAVRVAQPDGRACRRRRHPVPADDQSARAARTGARRAAWPRRPGDRDPLPDADVAAGSSACMASGWRCACTTLTASSTAPRGKLGLRPRVAAQGCAVRGRRWGGIIVEDHHVEEALHELVVEGGPLTRSSLGAGRAFQSPDEGND